MKISTPTVIALGSAPALTNAWSFGPSYFPSRLVLQSPYTMMERQQALANRVLKASSAQFSSPRYQVIDDDEKFQLSVDVPGVKVHDLDISLEDGYLTVRGQRMASSNHENSRFTSKFSQTFTLDPAVDEEQFSASLNNGVLVVTAPKDLKRIEENIKKIPIVENKAEEPKLNVAEASSEESKEETDTQVLDLDDGTDMEKAPDDYF